jgi:hypothetical protein
MERETNVKTSTRKPGMVAALLADGLCAAAKRRGKPDILGKRGGSHD